jgi:hypothetical protein
MATNYTLKAGYTLTATVNEGRAHVRSADGIDSAFTRSSVSFGPYLVDRVFLVDGDVSVTLAAFTTSFNSLLMSNAGAPANAAQAALTVNPTGDDNGLTYTARAYGTEGNSIKVAYTDPGANSAALSVSVFRQNITVSLATNGGGSITSTAAQVKAAIEAHTEANQLVTVAIQTGDSGTADDGSGVVTAMAASALTSGAGTGIGSIVPGGICIDTTNADIYRNDGTTAAPVWVKVGDAA